VGVGGVRARPVAGSIIISALPWSAVMSMARRAHERPYKFRPGRRPRFHGLHGGGNLAGVADHICVGEMTITTSKAESLTALMTASAIPPPTSPLQIIPSRPSAREPARDLPPEMVFQSRR